MAKYCETMHLLSSGGGRGYNVYFFHLFYFIYLSYELMNTFSPLEFAFEKKVYLSPNPNVAEEIWYADNQTCTSHKMCLNMYLLPFKLGFDF